jgi:hypothetical protein
MGLLADLANLVVLNMQHGRDAMVSSLRDIAKEQSGESCFRWRVTVLPWDTSGRPAVGCRQLILEGDA